MKLFSLGLMLAGLLIPVSLVLSQKATPAESRLPTDEVLKAIDARGDQLGSALASLRQQGVRDPWLADVEIY
ncbi:MAG: hypothetical protein JO112_06955, partial [Planctomycetes bacterium]|nr:hypothetical protein [Planctomycetota bacterium]